MLTLGGGKWEEVGSKERILGVTRWMNNQLLNSAVFVGKYDRALDVKHRVAVPSEWRCLVEEQRLFVLPGVTSKCLEVLPANVLNERIEKVKASTTQTAQKKKAFMRWVAENATMVVCDAQGRIRLSDEQRQHAGIEKSVVMSGTFDFFEIRSVDEHAAQNTLDISEVAMIADEFDF